PRTRLRRLALQDVTGARETIRNPIGHGVVELVQENRAADHEINSAAERNRRSALGVAGTPCRSIFSGPPPVGNVRSIASTHTDCKSNETDSASAVVSSSDQYRLVGPCATQGYVVF